MQWHHGRLLGSKILNERGLTSTYVERRTASRLITPGRNNGKIKKGRLIMESASLNLRLYFVLSENLGQQAATASTSWASRWGHQPPGHSQPHQSTPETRRFRKRLNRARERSRCLGITRDTKTVKPGGRYRYHRGANAFQALNISRTTALATDTGERAVVNILRVPI